MAAAALSDAHRRFLQALLSRGVVEAAEAERLRRLCFQRHPAPGGSEQLDDFLGALNAQLQPLSMEIRKGSAEDGGGGTFVALVNLAETEITKMAADFSESELELFKKTLDLILLSGNGFASSTEILNLADQLKPKKMKKMEVEQVLQQLVQKKWLCEKEGEYTLHIRSILELEQYIFRHYPESARKCHICHSLSVQVTLQPILWQLQETWITLYDLVGLQWVVEFLACLIREQIPLGLCWMTCLCRNVRSCE